jgi:hypothetical protein
MSIFSPSYIYIFKVTRLVNSGFIWNVKKFDKIKCRMLFYRSLQAASQNAKKNHIIACLSETCIKFFNPEVGHST